jgi:hypothetical protein
MDKLGALHGFLSNTGKSLIIKTPIGYLIMNTLEIRELAIEKQALPT